MKKQDSQLRGRRDFIKQAGFLGAGLLAGTSSLPAMAQITASSASSACNHDHQQTPFFGPHQAGITTPAQKHIYFMVLDLHSQDINEIKEMFQTWTKYSQKLTKGEMVEGYSENGYIPPKDTGEAEDLPTYNLTLTFGVSPSFFKKLNIEKFCPPELVDLPHFPRDQLREEYSGGDICIQACADDPQVAFHAVRNLVRVARSHITMHWSQSGFNSFDKHTPRNLFGFRDGTANLQQGEALDKVVWYQGNNWLKEGSFLIARRVQMFLETWDRTNLNEQQNTFGRYKQNGAAYGQKEEFDKVELGTDEKPILPEDSHVHLAKKAGMEILRRSYSYASGVDQKTGQFDTGLLFISFQHNPENFIKIQKMLGNIDKMNEYITHVGSGIFACFAGVKDQDDYLGKALFEQV
ncbi:iron uptake transporter deferrochelatase/peroxidase subunit [Haemophilus sputorum]|uniref:iron uptake transporter deferrochelatase/peroxidase subunit n=1 Tax=Haemophilus sputorum TaxID=1078480 RepID=UPI0028D83C93|nr:iron uptake transporter deferrochelatase/peroxidase subunit [Haemophilus sputorum]